MQVKRQAQEEREETRKNEKEREDTRGKKMRNKRGGTRRKEKKKNESRSVGNLVLLVYCQKLLIRSHPFITIAAAGRIGVGIH